MAQNEALAPASGAIRLTAMQALDTELNVTPIEWELRKTIYGTACRIRSSPAYREVCNIRNSVQPPPMPKRRSWDSPLKKAEKGIAKMAATLVPLEQNSPYTVNPWWIPIKCIIACNDEEAIKAHDDIVTRSTAENLAILYTDGSEVEEQVGSAAWFPAKRLHKCHYM